MCNSADKTLEAWSRCGWRHQKGASVASVASVADVADSLFAGLDRRGLGEMFCLDSNTL